VQPILGESFVLEGRSCYARAAPECRSGAYLWRSSAGSGSIANPHSSSGANPDARARSDTDSHAHAAARPIKRNRFRWRLVGHSRIGRSFRYADCGEVLSGSRLRRRHVAHDIVRNTLGRRHQWSSRPWIICR
jgi:hypothetical protein